MLETTEGNLQNLRTSESWNKRLSNIEMTPSPTAYSSSSETPRYIITITTF